MQNAESNKLVGEVLMLFPAEPSHVGLVPLQFSKTNKVPDPSYPSLAHYPGDNGGPGGYEERPRQRRSERPALEEYGGRTGREGGPYCECRNCQLERKYERKRRKKSEKVTWS